MLGHAYELCPMYSTGTMLEYQAADTFDTLYQEVPEQLLLARFFFRFHDFFFFFIEENSADFFLRFSSIFLLQISFSNFL